MYLTLPITLLFCLFKYLVTSMVTDIFKSVVKPLGLESSCTKTKFWDFAGSVRRICPVYIYLRWGSFQPRWESCCGRFSCWGLARPCFPVGDPAMASRPAWWRPYYLPLQRTVLQAVPVVKSFHFTREFLCQSLCGSLPLKTVKGIRAHGFAFRLVALPHCLVPDDGLDPAGTDPELPQFARRVSPDPRAFTTSRHQQGAPILRGPSVVGFAFLTQVCRATSSGLLVAPGSGYYGWPLTFDFTYHPVCIKKAFLDISNGTWGGGILSLIRFLAVVQLTLTKMKCLIYIHTLAIVLHVIVIVIASRGRYLHKNTYH